MRDNLKPAFLDRVIQARLLLVVSCIVLKVLGGVLPGEPLPSRGNKPCDLRRTLKIPMRDGVRLCASIYPPPPDDNGTIVRVPVIVTLTPYHRDSWEPWGSYFSSHGYAFASIDVRGRGDSEGRFEPYVNEAHDGYDAVEWLARQPFCDGKVGMWGGSYGGFNQWAVAREFPPHLRTIVPAAAAHPGVDVPFYDNIGQPYLLQWLASVSGDPLWERRAGDPAYWQEKFLLAYRRHIPFKSLDTFVGFPSPSFQRFLRHPRRDVYYDSRTPTAEQYRRIGIPVLTITGQYDDDAFGALTYYRDRLSQATPESAAKDYLVIGPWDHAGTRIPTAEVGGVKFGAAALVDVKDLHRQWYDWTLKGGAKPAFLEDRVAYYLLGPGNTGTGAWRYGNNLAALSGHATTFYFGVNGGGENNVAHPGVLSEKRPASGKDSFTYDPMNTRRGLLLDAVDYPNGDLIDPRYAESIHGDGLVYETAPLAEAKDLVGCPSLRLWLSVDTPDTDLEAYLYEIQPDGTSIRVWTHMCRLRYRESLRRAKLVKPGEIVRCDLAPGVFVARRLMQGSRLRLVVSSPNTILAEKNYNSGGVVAEETAKDAHVAHIQVYHDAEHASELRIPLRSCLKNS